MSAASAAQHGQDAFAIVGFRRAHQGVDRLFRSLEGLLRVRHCRPARTQALAAVNERCQATNVIWSTESLVVIASSLVRVVSAGSERMVGIRAPDAIHRS